MKEIKPVAAKKKPAFIKRRSAVKSKITPSKPGKAKPSKKIASSVKVKPTKAKVLVKPVKTNDPPMHAIKTKIASGAPTVIEVPPDTTMISQPAPVAEEPRPVEPPPARAGELRSAADARNGQATDFAGRPATPRVAIGGSGCRAAAARADPCASAADAL